MEVLGFRATVVISAVILNLLIPFILSPGMGWAESTGNDMIINFFSMLVHHKNIPVVSSVIVALIVFLSLVMTEFVMTM